MCVCVVLFFCCVGFCEVVFVVCVCVCVCVCMLVCMCELHNTRTHTHTHKHGYADTARRRHASQPHAACRGNSAPPPHASLPHVSPPPLPAACCSEHGGEREREFLRGRGARRTARVRASTLFAAARHAPPVPLVFMKRSARVCALCVSSCACRVRVCAHARVCVCVCVAAGARGCERVCLCMSP